MDPDLFRFSYSPWPAHHFTYPPRYKAYWTYPQYQYTVHYRRPNRGFLRFGRPRRRLYVYRHYVPPTYQQMFYF